MDFHDLVAERFSERNFASIPIEEEKLNRILEAGRIAPTARNKQPQRILVVRDTEGLEKMDRCTRCRFGAPVVLVLSYDMEDAARNADVVDFGVIDTSIVATHMMLAAAELGIHSCWVGLIDPCELRRQFNIPSDYRTISVMPLGYPSNESKPSPRHSQRKDINEVVFFDSYPQES